MNARWTINEEKQLINDIANSKSYDELASKYNRSANALELRIKKIVYDNIAAKRTPEMIGGQLNLPVDKVKQYFYSYKEMLEKRGKPVSGIDVNNNIKQETIGAGNNISAKPNNLNMSMSAGNIKNKQMNVCIKIFNKFKYFLLNFNISFEAIMLHHFHAARRYDTLIFLWSQRFQIEIVSHIQSSYQIVRVYCFQNQSCLKL